HDACPGHRLPRRRRRAAGRGGLRGTAGFVNSCVRHWSDPFRRFPRLWAFPRLRPARRMPAPILVRIPDSSCQVSRVDRPGRGGQSDVRAGRLLSVLLLLQNRGRLTAREIADELGVSIRTVYRDLDSLGEAGVPVLAERGSTGGYR